MRKKTIIIIFVAVTLVLASIVYFVSQFWDMAVFIQTMSKETQQEQIRLLCKTDHQALLDACRELSQRFDRGDLKFGQYNVHHDPHPDVSGFPKPIIDLRPKCVTLGKYGEVKLEMMGGFDHFGVSFYPDNYKKPSFAGFKLGDKKLIDGLWYYDDGYEDNPRYQKKIEALIQKGKMRTQAKNQTDD